MGACACLANGIRAHGWHLQPGIKNGVVGSFLSFVYEESTNEQVYQTQDADSVLVVRVWCVSEA